MKDVLIFHDNELVMDLEEKELHSVSKSMLHGNYKFYSEAFVYFKESPLQYLVHADFPIAPLKPAWFRMDGTPVLLEDVPKQYRALLLILNSE